MDYSVIFATCNRDQDLKVAIDSVLRQTVLPREIIIVDQSDGELTRSLAEELEKQQGGRVAFSYIFRKQKSITQARNAGIAVARGEIVSFLDDDVELFPDYYEVILRRFAADPSLGGIGGGIINVQGPRGWKWPVRKLLHRVFLINNFRGRLTPSGFGFPIHDGDVDREVEVECLCGSNMNFRRQHLGPSHFDDWFSGYSYAEDIDATYRVSRQARLLAIPDARLEHHHSKVHRMKKAAARAMEIKNHHHIYKKLARKSLLTDLLFIYSVTGWVGIAALEYLARRDDEHLEALKGYAQGLASLLRKAH
jgi:glycosyltransferase involved in cell wall biosynthesis